MGSFFSDNSYPPERSDTLQKCPQTFSPKSCYYGKGQRPFSREFFLNLNSCLTHSNILINNEKCKWSPWEVLCEDINLPHYVKRHHYCLVRDF